LIKPSRHKPKKNSPVLGVVNGKNITISQNSYHLGGKTLTGCDHCNRRKCHRSISRKFGIENHFFSKKSSKVRRQLHVAVEVLSRTDCGKKGVSLFRRCCSALTAGKLKVFFFYARTFVRVYGKFLGRVTSILAKSQCWNSVVYPLDIRIFQCFKEINYPLVIGGVNHFQGGKYSLRKLRDNMVFHGDTWKAKDIGVDLI